MLMRGIASLFMLLIFAGASGVQDWTRTSEASNMRIIGHSDLNGQGNGGEGLILQQYPNGRRILFLAHERAPLCFSVIDVTSRPNRKS
jgi:hypothetical protein